MWVSGIYPRGKSLQSRYYFSYTPSSSLATQSLDDVHFRASYELLPDVLLVTSALKNIVQTSSSGK